MKKTTPAAAKPAAKKSPEFRPAPGAAPKAAGPKKGKC